MKTTTDSHCVAVFGHHRDAERALRALEHASFDTNKLSIIGRGRHAEGHAVGFYRAADRVKYWGRHGAFWGALFGIVLAPASLWIPGIGPIVTRGIVGSMLLGAIEGGAVGAAVLGGTSAFAAALFGLGVPKDTVIQLERELGADRFLLIASVPPAEVECARGLLAEHEGQAQISGTDAAHGAHR